MPAHALWERPRTSVERILTSVALYRLFVPNNPHPFTPPFGNAITIVRDVRVADVAHLAANANLYKVAFAIVATNAALLKLL